MSKVTKCNRNNPHILNSHLCGAIELRQVGTVAPSRKCFILLFRYDQLRSSFGRVRTAFAVEKIFKTGESVISIQKTFRVHFILRRNNAISDRQTIQLWIENPSNTGSSIKRKPSGIIKELYLSESGRNTARHDSWYFYQPLKTWSIQAISVTDRIWKIR